MKKLLFACALLGLVGCTQGTQEDTDIAADLTAPACSVVASPGVDGTPAFVAQSGFEPSFTRSFFPRFVRQGGWSSSAQFVQDTQRLTIPAITAMSASGAAWMPLPVETNGATMIGVTLVICGDATTLIEADTYATEFISVSAPSLTNLSDALHSTGSQVTGGQAGGQGGQWRTFDVDTLDVSFTNDSTLWLSVFATQPPSPPNTPPPSMAIARVIVNYVN